MCNNTKRLFSHFHELIIVIIIIIKRVLKGQKTSKISNVNDK